MTSWERTVRAALAAENIEILKRLPASGHLQFDVKLPNGSLQRVVTACSPRDEANSAKTLRQRMRRLIQSTNQPERQP